MEDIKSPEALRPLPKKAGGFKKFVQRFTIVLLLVLLLFGYWKYYFTYSAGWQVGKMQKISKKGNIFKTWEGYLLTSISTDNNNLSLMTKEFPFSVTSDSLARVLENYEGKRVKVEYRQKHGTLPWRGDSEYLVFGVVLDQ